MIELPLHGGSAALIDDEDYERCSRYAWHRHNRGYAHAQVDGKKVLLHRFVMNAVPGVKVDHRNRNKLDCQKANLRPATQAENTRNSGPKHWNTSGYKGVSWSKTKRKWQVQICIEGKQTYVGRYDDIVEAAMAYDAKAREQYGEFAFVNFPAEARNELA